MPLPCHLVGVMAMQVLTISQWQLQHVWAAALEMAVAGTMVVTEIMEEIMVAEMETKHVVHLLLFQPFTR